jgi:hypothetical protein
MRAAMFAGTSFISGPNKRVRLMYVVSGATLKWVRVVTVVECQNIAAVETKHLQTQKQ